MKTVYTIFVILILFQHNQSAQIKGCTDPLATNYNNLATVNDGTCAYATTSISPTSSINLPSVMNETSGLIFWNAQLWTHNDDADTHLYNFSADKLNEYQLLPLTGTNNNDWEEITQDDHYLYIGDFGNNANGNRTDLMILRIDKQQIINHLVIDTIHFAYDKQTNFEGSGANNTNFDCEAFIADNDSLYLFTKEWISNQTSVYAIPKTPGTHIAQYKTSYNIQGLITGATYLKELNCVVLCGYNSLVQPFLWLLYDFNTNNFFEGNKRKLNLSIGFHQVEGIATNNGLNYYLTNEKLSQSIININAKLHQLNLSPYLRDYFLNSKNETSYQLLKPYPNPVKSVLNIELTDTIGQYQLKIFNAVGQTIHTENVVNKTTIHTNHWPNGIYILKTSNGLISQTVKIVKE